MADFLRLIHNGKDNDILWKSVCRCKDNVCGDCIKGVLSIGGIETINSKRNFGNAEVCYFALK